ncbi:DUF2786 domain-containing protein, partial [Escherichia coli]|nr:DUF2786 domain-containing protein [Escherichia coli]MDM8819708.1 DUF2786 domain-containing protein [Escherichia coli]
METAEKYRRYRTMTDQNKHIEKLKKLLALAASGNP